MIRKKVLGAAIMASLMLSPVAAFAQDSDDEMAAGTAASGSSEGVILALLALGAVGLGVYAAVDGDTDDAPVSP